jgi:threonine synthase
VTVACLKQMVETGLVRRDEETVAVITGGGLKTIEAVQDRIAEPLRIPARVQDFDAALAAREAAPVPAGA